MNLRRFKENDVDGAMLSDWAAKYKANPQEFTKNIKEDFKLNMAQISKFEKALGQLAT